jgi:hypothetical protein
MNQSQFITRKPSKRQIVQNTTSAVLNERHLLGCHPEAAAYAMRVWNGQATVVPVRERVSRVLNALRGQGMVQ